MNFNFLNTYTTLPADFFTAWLPQKVKAPKLFCFNTDLAHTLEIKSDDLSEEALADYFSGNTLFEDSSPIALAYAGHQFGYFNMLGDGRAVLLGEILDPTSKRYDIQLKSSGPTPYSRGGDGRGTLSAMLREYLISEAMHHLGIKATRSLAVVETGEEVIREKLHKGAILTRVARSHLRIGSFEYAKEYCQEHNLEALLDYSISREYPHLKESANKALAFLEEIMEGQITLIVDWMRVGFIHGVMNTDNMSISCETIDFGPCAFMNIYNPKTVFSSIDKRGRYCFENQPWIARWNLSVLAETLLPLIDKERDNAIEKASAILERFTPLYEQKYTAMMCQKLGLERVETKDKDLIISLLDIMHKKKLDYTNTFALLGFEDNKPFLSLGDELKEWYAHWQSRVGDSNKAKALMRPYNPRIIPRNHLVEEALLEAQEGNTEKFYALLHELKTPYNSNKALQDVPNGFDGEYKTFCGT